MDIVILSMLGVLALAIIGFEARKAAKGFSSQEDKKCRSCMGCSNSCSINREDNGR